MTRDSDVVVVGMACRYPEADDPHQLWQNVLSRRRSFRRMPPQRLPLEEYGDGVAADLTYLTHAAVLDGWSFDRKRFKVPGATFRAVDLSHWLALEVSAAVLADAGLPDGDGLDRGRVGVVLGNSLTGEFSRAGAMRVRWPYVRRAVGAALAATTMSRADQESLLDDIEALYKAPFPTPSDETLAGALSNTIAGRICNHFDFHGTGYTVDGACASSLLAVASAADAVAAGTLDVALAGGVDLSLDPFELVGFARVGALARGDMRVYDAHPTGFLPGEGCGLVALCTRAFADGHGLRPYARLVGWATSSDGSGGLTRPEATGQALALERAYQRAGLAPADVGLVEGHGTGTAVGDETELRTLLEVRGAAARPAVIGSIKANIGHTKAAAGAAGLIKALLAVHHEVLPPTTGCPDPHPLLAAPGASLRVAHDADGWPDGRRYAAVSAMGFGGINAHVVLGDAGTTTRRGLSQQERRYAARQPDHEVVVCTASNPAQLQEALTTLRDTAGTLSRGELTDLAATLAADHRAAAPARFACAVADPDALVEATQRALAELAAGRCDTVDPDRGLFLGRGTPGRVGLLFSGQAAPTYPDAGSLGDLLPDLPPGYPDDLRIPSDGPADTSVAQPAIVRASLLGLRWLDLLGVHAEQALGHSLGELTALAWAGALTEAECYALARARGAAMAAASPVPSGMASLSTDRITAAELVLGTGAVLAVDNGPQQVVVSGPHADVERVLSAAAGRGIWGTRLPVSHAFHSPLMAAAADPLRAAMREIRWREPGRPVASTITGGWWDPAQDPQDLLVRQLTSAVRFHDAMRLLDADLFVEVGPGHVLSHLAGVRAVSLDAGSPGAAAVAGATAALFAAGACDSVLPYLAARFSRPFDLTAPRRFLVSPCEIDPPQGAAARPRTAASAAGTKRHATGAPAPSRPATASPGGPRSNGAAQPDRDPLAVVTARLAEALELDAADLQPDARLLADLHLGSLRVSQLAESAAADLGRALPAAPLALAGTTVAGLAEAVAGLPAAGADTDPPAAGVAHWVRAFSHHLIPRPPAGPPSLDHDWHHVGLSGHPLAAAILARFTPVAGAPPARLLAIAPGTAGPPLADIVAALRDCAADRRPLVVVHHAGVGAAVGRSLAVEEPEVPVLVVEVPAGADGIALAAAEARRPWQGYREVVYAGDGVRTVPVTRAMDVSPRHDQAIPLARGETCVVTGGGRGIAAECAVALSAATGAHMVLLGRAAPHLEEVRTTLRRIHGGGATAEYHQVDVTDRDAVRATLAAVGAQRPVRMLLHAAGTNEPARIGDLDAAALDTLLAAKVDGLRNVLDALDGDTLRTAVTFGSVIGRTGLAGQTGYAVANEWLARRCHELTTERPRVRWLNLEWSAWSQVGMATRLGTLDALVRQGLSPIPVEEGVDILLRLLATPDLPATVMVAGRLPESPTLEWAESDPIRGRFLETGLAHTPGVELVAEATLGLGTDPYLADHRIDGMAVLPAVLGMEAMAQASAALGGKPTPAVFRDLRLRRPITVPERDSQRVRLAALARSGGVDVVARSAETGFSVDHFAGWYGAAEAPGPPAGAVPPQPPAPADGLYGPLFFHGPRFARVRGYHALSAYRCAAAVAALPDHRWFGGFQDQRLVLGDPGARDAFLHALQACVPDRRVLPVAAERVTVLRSPDGPVTLEARQRGEYGDDYVFDLTVRDADGQVTEEWRGLALHAIGPRTWDRLPPLLVGAYLTRTLRRWRPEVRADLLTAPAQRTDPDRSTALAAWLADRAVAHAGDGRLVTVDTDASAGVRLSASHLDDQVLVAAAPGPVAVDWERVAGRPPLDGPTAHLAAQLAGVTGDDAAAATLAWTCREVLGKRGLPPDAPAVLAGTGPDGWVRLRAGACTLYGVLISDESGRVAVCVGMG